MSLTASRQAEIEHRVSELLAQQYDHQAQSQLLEEMRQRVKEYEARYGIPSSRIHEAIEAGELDEDRDVGHWIFAYNLLCRVEEA
jgi:hypothetical protein